MTVLCAALLVTSFIQAASAQCLNGQSTNCGSFCCPPNTNSIFDPAGSLDSSGNIRDQCCRSQFGSIQPGCCSFRENQFSTCDGRICPDRSRQGEDESRDDNGRLRAECCKFFRSGCCSPEENDSLETLFQITIGASVAVGVLIFLVVPLILICCFCSFCPKTI